MPSRCRACVFPARASPPGHWQRLHPRSNPAQAAHRRFLRQQHREFFGILSVPTFAPASARAPDVPTCILPPPPQPRPAAFVVHYRPGRRRCTLACTPPVSCIPCLFWRPRAVPVITCIEGKEGSGPHGCRVMTLLAALRCCCAPPPSPSWRAAPAAAAARSWLPPLQAGGQEGRVLGTCHDPPPPPLARASGVARGSLLRCRCCSSSRISSSRFPVSGGTSSSAAVEAGQGRHGQGEPLLWAAAEAAALASATAPPRRCVHDALWP